MDRSAGGGWSVGGVPVIPPPWWVERLNAERRRRGQPEVSRYSGLAMAVWSMASAPPLTPLVHVSGC
jgi:hypothetical protein